VDSETGRWTCFSQCGRGGSLIDFEMALTGTEFKAALAAVYGIVGRPLPDRIRMTRDDWRRVQEAREREERERREAFFFAEAAATMAEQALEILQTWDDERRVHAKLLEDLKADAVAVYRDWREYNPAMAAGLVAAGRNLDRRWQKTLLGFVEDMAAEGYPGAA
jgi:enoyl-CoA hydratase/carnithine racemase